MRRKLIWIAMNAGLLLAFAWMYYRNDNSQGVGLFVALAIFGSVYVLLRREPAT